MARATRSRSSVRRARNARCRPAHASLGLQAPLGLVGVDPVELDDLVARRRGPRRASRRRAGRRACSASSRSTASLARPRSGGAATRTFQPSPWRPTSSSRPAPGRDAQPETSASASAIALSSIRQRSQAASRARLGRVSSRGSDVRLALVHGVERGAQQERGCGAPRRASARARRAPLRVIARASACASSRINSASRLRLVLQLLRRALGGDERRAEQRLELPVPGDLVSSCSTLVLEVRPLTPDRLRSCRRRRRAAGRSTSRAGSRTGRVRAGRDGFRQVRRPCAAPSQ